MKICFYNVTASFIPGGLETYCWEMGRALARRGHHVAIVAGNRGEPRHSEVELVRFPFRIEQSWPNFGTRFRRLMERLSFAWGGGLKHLVEGSYDAIIINKPFDFPVLWLARKRGMQARTLFRSGGTDFFLGDRLFADVIDHWVSTSRYNAAQIENRYQRSVKVISNGVDTDLFQPSSDVSTKEKFRLPQDARFIVSVGRLVGWKGLQVIIAALAGLPKDVHYLVAGEGPEQQQLATQAHELGLDDRVHFVGRVAHADLPRLLNLATLFAQPSIGEEAFGISLVEAMACGLPVLASDNGGMKEIVVSGETGELLPAGNAAAWQRSLTALLENNSRAAAMGEAARRRAVEHFTWAANAAQVEKLLFGG